jgi:hypothetical protein
MGREFPALDFGKRRVYISYTQPTIMMGNVGVVSVDPPVKTHLWSHGQGAAAYQEGERR